MTSTTRASPSDHVHRRPEDHGPPRRSVRPASRSPGVVAARSSARRAAPATLGGPEARRRTLEGALARLRHSTRLSAPRGGRPRSRRGGARARGSDRRARSAGPARLPRRRTVAGRPGAAGSRCVRPEIGRAGRDPRAPVDVDAKKTAPRHRHPAPGAFCASRHVSQTASSSLNSNGGTSSIRSPLQAARVCQPRAERPGSSPIGGSAWRTSTAQQTVSGVAARRRSDARWPRLPGGPRASGTAARRARDRPRIRRVLVAALAEPTSWRARSRRWPVALVQRAPPRDPVQLHARAPARRAPQGAAELGCQSSARTSSTHHLPTWLPRPASPPPSAARAGTAPVAGRRERRTRVGAARRGAASICSTRAYSSSWKAGRAPRRRTRSSRR